MTLSDARLVVATFTVPPPQVTQFCHLDVLGSVRAVTSDTGAVMRRHDYAAFGEDLEQEDPAYAVPADAKQQRFTGKERDTDTFLDYFEARYYRNQWGRFTTADPGHVGGDIFDPQSSNAYAYARNNPLRFVDPRGAEYEINWANDGGWSRSYVSDDVWRGALSSLGWGFEVQGNNILTWRDGRWVIAAYFTWQPDRPRTFGEMVQQAGERAAQDTIDGVRAMAINSAFAGVGGLVRGATAARAVTKHGLERIAGAGATRGGVLSSWQIPFVRLLGHRMTSSVNGTVVKVLRVGDRYHVVIDGERGIVTTFRGFRRRQSRDWREILGGSD